MYVISLEIPERDCIVLATHTLKDGSRDTGRPIYIAVILINHISPEIPIELNVKTNIYIYIYLIQLNRNRTKQNIVVICFKYYSNCG